MPIPHSILTPILLSISDPVLALEYVPRPVFNSDTAISIKARPKWQYLPAVPGYVPVYIRNGDTPLEDINPELAEAFHALPAGRGPELLKAASEVSENAHALDAPEVPELGARGTFQDIPYQMDEQSKRYHEKKQKKVVPDLPVEDS
ncbi:hypothetical protein EVAR_11118_1 [Eumeta japonica]|uniref:Uncharacterized protein n=1 Tax=Eumeta variegata TaxID=151549 RepID=A0A4C1U4N6_EUMVA|nr:hypothetical protein EVAR_11118_1 [Eumeta japonica]